MAAPPLWIQSGGMAAALLDETVAGVFRVGRPDDVYDVVLRHTIQTDGAPSFKPKY